MRFVKLTVVVFFLVCFWGGYASAGFSCPGKVSSIALGPASGTLQVNAGYGVHYLCKIHIEHNGVHPEICKAWYSMFLSAQATGRQVIQYYDESAGGAQSCSELGSWKVPNPLPYYVTLNN